MLNIDATDKIEGIASVADKVEFTCSVVDGTDVKSSEGLLSNVQTQIYLAVAATRILSLTLVNTHTSAVTVNIQKDPTDAGTLYRIIPKDLSLGVGYSLVFDGQRCTVMDASGNITSSLANPMDAAGELIYGGANGVMTALAAGAITKILVGGGAAAPVWTEATGTGAPVRAGAPTFTGQATIPTINLTGGQIAFPATAVPSADANTLDDYEEGTCTLEFRGSTARATTPVEETGYYTKIGNKVFCVVSFSNVDTTGAIGNQQVVGFPFTSKNQASCKGSHSVSTYNLDIPGLYATGSLPINSTTMGFISSVDDGAWIAIQIKAAAGKYLQLTANYLT